MEGLLRKIIQQQDKDLKVHQRAPEIPHLFFAYDAPFFLKVNLDNIWNMRNILNNVCNISGEMINIHKSYIVFSKNAHEKIVRLLTNGA